MKSLITAIVCISTTCLAEPIFIRLLPEGHEAKDEIKISLDAAELSISIKNMLHDFESITDSMKKDGKSHVIDIPVPSTDEPTVKAIANALTAMQYLKVKKEKLTYMSLKKIVKSCFPNPNVTTSKDFFNLILTINFLDVEGLLQPAVAAWVDQQQKDNADFWKKLPQKPLMEIKEVLAQLEGMPKELLPLFDDYWSWLKNPIKLIAHTEAAKALAADNHSLYALSRDEHLTHRIHIIDPETNKFRDNLEVRKGQFSDLKIAGNKLYLAHNLKVASIDVTRDKLRDLYFGQAFFDTPSHPIRLCISKNKLYALQLEGHISWFDVTANIAKKSSITTFKAPLRLESHDDFTVDGESLYVTQSKLNTVAVVDLKKRNIRKSIKLDKEPTALILGGNKLYVANKTGNSISVINVLTDSAEPSIKVGNEPVALAVVGTLLFVGNRKDKTISVIDIFTNRVIGNPIALSSEPIAFAVSGKKLYVATLDGSIGYLNPLVFLYYGT